ncbi:MAG: signal peptidase I [Syntrophobacterales bacterium]|nr:signal peptidase I [Syntrophobacterales bacterium]OPX40120.1 MAG: signal peptidase I [Desulfobacteraceae bacterium 4484_190.3]
MGKNKKSIIKEYIKAIFIAIVIALFIRTFFVQAFKIPSGSMIPTLQIGDWLLVNKFIYGIKIPLIRKTLIPVKNPQRGDIAVFIYPMDRSKDFIKRVIGVGGDIIEIKNKKIYINGSPFDDTYGVFTDSLILPRSMQPRDNFGPVKVPEGHIFVMGDNRDNSYDSRFWGFVNLNDVIGKAFIIYWSWNGKKHNVRWNRLAKILH